MGPSSASLKPKNQKPNSTHLKDFMGILFLDLCDDLLYMVGDNLRLIREDNEREFQCSLVENRRKTFLRPNLYGDDDSDSDDDEMEIEFFVKTLQCSVHNESHLHYHPSSNLEGEMVKRYQVWMNSHHYEQNVIDDIAPCTNGWQHCLECERIRHVISREQRSHANTSRKHWGNSPITKEACIYKRVRDGCQSCTEDSLLCDYCCRQGSKKKNRRKWGFMKYKKGEGRKSMTVDRRCSRRSPSPDFNTYVPTHKTPPGSHRKSLH